MRVGKKLRGLPRPRPARFTRLLWAWWGATAFVTLTRSCTSSAPGIACGENDIYVEDDKTLNPKTRDRFEVEANYGGGQLIFPATSWEDDANSGDCDFASVNALAERYGVSIRAAFRHFVEAQQTPCVGLSYLPNDFALREEDGHRRLHKPIMFRSFGFRGFSCQLGATFKGVKLLASGHDRG